MAIIPSAGTASYKQMLLDLIEHLQRLTDISSDEFVKFAAMSARRKLVEVHETLTVLSKYTELRDKQNEADTTPD